MPEGVKPFSLLLSTLLALSLVCAPPPTGAQAAGASLRLVVTVAPAKIPADGGEYPVYVQLVNEAGYPVRAPQDIVVRLFSSDERVGRVTPQVTLREGELYATATFTASWVPGTTAVTAAAAGYAPGSTVVTTYPPVGYPRRIALYPLPPVLPPDESVKGRLLVELQDAAGNPARAPRDVTVALRSSNPLVVDVDGSAVIAAGQTHAVVEFYAKGAPGTATVTATALGYESGATTISTVAPKPAKLVVRIAPDVLPAVDDKERAYARVAVYLLDRYGYPARAGEDVYVRLTSSNVSVAYFEERKLVIPAGEFYSSTVLYAGGEAGAAVIAAHAQGLEPSMAMAVARPPVNVSLGQFEGFEGQLKVYASPDVVPPGDEVYGGSIVVQLLDKGGLPVSVEKSIMVYLSSSDLLYGDVFPSVVLVEAGDFMAFANFSSTLSAGATTITASAEGFRPGNVTVRTSAPPPNRLKLYAPPHFRATGEEYGLIAVQLLDLDGNPARAPVEVEVLLSSSNPGVGDVSAVVTVRPGSTFAFATFYSTTTIGTTEVTAMASGYESDYLMVTAIEPFPSVLSAAAYPPLLLADGSTYQLVVQLLDSAGRPAKPSLPTEVFAFSDNPAVAEVEESAVLPAGAAYAVLDLASTETPGNATLTVAAQGCIPASVTVSTLALPLEVSLVPSKANVTLGEAISLEVTVTSYGVPVSDATVAFQAAIGSVTAKAVTGPDGKATATYTAMGVGIDNVTVTVSKRGYVTASASIPINVIELPLEVSLLIAEANLTVGESVPLTVVVTSEGEPVSEATVTLETLTGIVAARVTTGPDGRATVTYKATEVGLDVVAATASKPGYVPASANLTVHVVKFVNVRVELVTDEGVPLEGVRVTLTAPDGRSLTAKTDVSGIAEFTDVVYGSMSITVEPTVAGRPGVRYVFDAWGDGTADTTWSGYVADDVTLSAIYRTQFFVSVSSPYGATRGSGWYDRGVTVVIDVTPTAIEISFFQTKRFQRWTGDITAGTPEATVFVDSPKAITAVWYDDFTNLYITVGVAAVIGVWTVGGALLYLRRRRKMAQPEEEEEEEEW